MERLDKLLLAKGLAGSRSHAQRLIEAGRVYRRCAGVDEPLAKVSAKLPEDSELVVLAGDEDRYVSRAGLKLAGALSHTELEVSGWTALDIGQSTGGFTDCLLQAGAARVIGVDVGRDQLVGRLRDDPRVVCLEGINARQLPGDELLGLAPGGFDLLVMDVSFISQTLILPGLPALMRPSGQLLSLVKPQFEVGREGIGKGGIVRDDSLYPRVAEAIRQCGQSLGLTVRDYFPSPIAGGDGNREFFAWMSKSP